MKQNLYAGLCLATLSAALALTSTGCCCQRICIKTVDATTKEPLAGVVVQWQQNRNQMFEQRLHYGSVELSPSRQDGVIMIDGLHRTWESLFVFSCPGYSNVYGYYKSGEGVGLGAQITYFPPGRFGDEFFLSGETEKAVNSNGYFLVAMPKAK